MSPSTSSIIPGSPSASFTKCFPRSDSTRSTGPAAPRSLLDSWPSGAREKFQADLYIAGQGSHVSVLYPAKALAPMPPAFILPEVKDESKWFKGKHRFVDPETRHSFVFQGHRGLYSSTNSQSQSWWDLINPKWKGTIIGYDPTVAGVARNVLGYFYMYEQSPRSSIGWRWGRRPFASRATTPNW